MSDPIAPALPPARKHHPRRAMLAVLAATVVLSAGWAAFDAAPVGAVGAVEPRMHGSSAHESPRLFARDAVHPPKIDWSIAITAVGLQAEVDQCQWVLMDFSSAVPLPIVAAHNFCGGGIVLEMVPGQRVVLSGAGLDGAYTVVASKDAWADQDAADALSGLAGDVILQTCYWEDNGHLSLVALQRTA